MVTVVLEPYLAYLAAAPHPPLKSHIVPLRRASLAPSLVYGQIKKLTLSQAPCDHGALGSHLCKLSVKRTTNSSDSA
jgi:hypothetical protein